MPQNDIANSGLGSFAGKPLINGSMTCSVLPTGTQLGKRYERNPFPAVLEPSGLNTHYGVNTEHRFSHHFTLT